MSKAFTRESDDAPDDEARPRASPLPPGARNYLTADGAQRLRAELDRLLQVDRPRAVAAGQPVRSIDQRIHDLTVDLDGAEVVEPVAHGDRAPVRFGAAVTVRDDDERDRDYRIVGVAEADPRRGEVSYLSPLARALLGARLGDRVALPVRHGSGSGNDDSEVEIVAITYPGA